MHNLEQKQAGDISRFQRIEEQLSSNPTQEELSQVKQDLQGIQLDINDLNSQKTASKEQAKKASVKAKKFEDHINYITRHLDRLEINMKNTDTSLTDHLRSNSSVLSPGGPHIYAGSSFNQPQSFSYNRNLP